MICPSCSFNNRGPGKCWACGFQMSPEEEKVVYVIPKKSKKQERISKEDEVFFKQIWATRPHYSEVSGDFLGDEYNPCFFSHILTKAAYPRFRHYEKNICLMTWHEHNEWEFTERKDPKWNELRDEAEELIIEYYNPPVI